MSNENKNINQDRPWLPSPQTWKGTWRDDWRITGQEGYLLNKQLQLITFDRSMCFEDHDQCDFCNKIFDKDPKHPLKAYYEPINKVWICQNCFDDFKEHFYWGVSNDNN